MPARAEGHQGAGGAVAAPPAPAIELRSISKVFGRGRSRRVVLDGLDLTVPVGTAVGLLGPNGAGKTTALRIAAGLVHADAGTVRIAGRPLARATPQLIDRVGAMIDGPRTAPDLTARRTLVHLADLRGHPRWRVAWALDLVGLGDRSAEPVRGFSLGMRQRLGLAATLLKDPTLLLLDEPSNGLDPTGTAQLLDVLGQLRDEGRSILVSSHLLDGVERLCDEVVVLAGGRAAANTRVAAGHGLEVLRAHYERVVEAQGLVGRWGA